MHGIDPLMARSNNHNRSAVVPSRRLAAMLNEGDTGGYCQVAQDWTGEVERQRSDSNHGPSGHCMDLTPATPLPNPSSPISRTNSQRKRPDSEYSVEADHRKREIQLDSVESFSKRKLLTRLLKTLRQTSTGFALFGAHQAWAVSQPSCFLRVAWQLDTGRVLQAQSPSFNQPNVLIEPELGRFRQMYSFAYHLGFHRRLN
ncbi:hypothetical protein T265_07325 [Opisthorchis viverrini]|uniref:Uncharacterized protein n=1 Tax=Opisthorchis viverrini TaxID=6198 RepID=A0A074ZD30_OPIVI|nr:hypothetical protein T265_07325 [Opisthorchis viverrini]KER25161.1 hypothetical protein T265_07325 [Opisthorchis viverrini]